MKQYSHFIDNEWVIPSSNEWFNADDPFSGQPWAQIARGNTQDVDRAVGAAKKAFEGEWSNLTATQRGTLGAQ